jgi:SsrA-binding protein
MVAHKKIKKEHTRYIAQNKKARYDYHILSTYEAGVELCGTEVKSCRDGRVSLKEAYARVIRGEIWVVGMHISPYAHGRFGAHDEVRNRKLLLHKAEIRKLARELELSGHTLIPLAFYWKKHLVKCRLALGTGKKSHDKRATISKRESDRSLQRLMKERNQP